MLYAKGLHGDEDSLHSQPEQTKATLRRVNSGPDGHRWMPTGCTFS